MLITRLNVISLFADNYDQIKPHGKLLLSDKSIDVNLLFNYVWSVDSMQAGEAWTPLCVPGCSEQYMLHAYTCFKTENLGMVLVCMDHTPKTLEACHEYCHDVYDFLNLPK